MLDHIDPVCVLLYLSLCTLNESVCKCIQMNQTSLILSLYIFILSFNRALNVDTCQPVRI